MTPKERKQLLEWVRHWRAQHPTGNCMQAFAAACDAFSWLTIGYEGFRVGYFNRTEPASSGAETMDDDGNGAAFAETDDDAPEEAAIDGEPFVLLDSAGEGRLRVLVEVTLPAYRALGVAAALADAIRSALR